MPNVGPMELVIVLVVALIVLGPKRLPEVGRSLGNGLREFKDSLSNPDHSDDAQLDIEEPPEPVATAAATAPAAPADDEK
ncbi:MAG TPA: twin-arginine translocase TatA/TatE family subunit [Thermoleophilaceae bacterium]